MLYTEFNFDDFLAVRCEEAWEDGRDNEKLEIARNLLAEGSTPDFVQKITGLSLEEIEKLQA